MSLKQRSSFVLFMHRFVPVLTVLLAVFSIFVLNLRSAPVAEAATNSTINFQARLQSASGAIVPDGNYNIQFKLYGAASGGTALWTENYYNNASQGARTVNGYFNVKLGSVTAFPSTINWDQELWLTMNVGGTTTGTPTLDGEMDPRLKLTAVPYALSAGQLQTTSGSNMSKLSIQAPTGGNQVFQIQDQGAAGTYNILTAPSGSDGYVKLQGGTPGTQQGGNLNISGTGIFATGLSTAQLTANGQSILGGGSDQAQLIIKANASQSASNPLIVLKDSSNGELARISADANANFFAGGSAGAGITTGDSNTGIGTGTLSGLTSGGGNVGIGTSTLVNVGSGDTNVGIGYGAGWGITGNGNIAIGKQALYDVAGVSNIIGIGYHAGNVVGADGDFYNNIFFGTNSGSSGAYSGDSDGFATIADLHNAAGIGNAVQVQASNTIVLGGIGTDAQKVVIGSTMGTGSNLFGVSPVIYNTGTASQSGNTITGTGTTWNSANGVRVGMRFIFADGTDGGTITAVNNTTTLTVSTSQTVSTQNYRIHNIGFQVTNTGDAYVRSTSSSAFSIQDANGNALLTADTSGSTVTATGQTILGGNANQTQVIIKANASQGAGNPLLVLQASGGAELARITSDSNGNFYAGYVAGGTTSSGTINTAVGSDSLSSLTTGSYNTATGGSALNRVTSGSNNIGVGSNAGGNITDGQGNVAIGSVALGTNAHGWNNIGIGYGADVGSDSINNSVAIGAYSLVTQDDSLVLGCIAGNGGCGVSTKIAIGNTAPAGLFSVGSSSQFQVDINGNFKTTGGTELIKTTDTNAFQIQNSSADNIFNVDSSNRKITIGDATNGGVIINYGATLNAAKALSNFTSDGAIGTAAATVDTHTSFTINQTTASISLTIPSPTDTTAGRIIYIANIGSASVTVGGTALAAGNNAMFFWNGSTWANAMASGGGGGGSFVTLQGSTPGTADSGNLNITGTATFGTAANTGDLTATGQTILGGSTDQTQVVIKANGSQSASNPLLEFQDSTGAEKARISISDNGDFFWGWLSGSSLSGGSGSNTGIGNAALMGITSGGYNTAIGASALSNLTTGGQNIAIGAAAANNLTADNNIAIGVSSLYNAGDSYNTVAIGRGAGAAIGSGTTWGNTFLGYSSGYGDDDGFATVATLHNATAIGNYAQVQANDTIVLGGIGTAQAKVVIGSTMGTGSNIFGVSPVIDHTGTASQSGSTVTGSGTSWTTSGVKVGMRLIFADGTDGGTITAIGSDTSLTVATSQTVSSQAYRIHNIGFQVRNDGTSYVQATATNAFQVANADGSALLTADTSTSTITINGNLAINGHIITGGSAPSISAGAAACSSPTVGVSGTDTAGLITVTTGSSCTSGKVAGVTFDAAFGSAPRVVLTPANSATSSLQSYVDSSTISTTGFDVGAGASTTASTTYKWYYQVLQ